MTANDKVYKWKKSQISAYFLEVYFLQLTCSIETRAAGAGAGF